ncbi:MAG: recombinase family protein, partial [Candidatus Margulisiibacteriota bacterium]
NRVGMVIVYKIDRLTRSPKDFYHLIEIFDQANVAFLSVTERFDTSTPSGRLLRNIMLTFAQFERELTSERTKDKMLERAKKGLFGGGTPPFGYQRLEKKLVVEPGEAQIVREMFNLMVATGSIAKVYDYAKAKSVLNKNGRLFSKSSLTYLLRNILYTGKIAHLGQTYQGIHAPIISEEQFLQVQKISFTKKPLRWSPVKPFLFPGLVVCRECGSIMTPTYTNKIKNGKRRRYFYYRCTCTLKRDWQVCSVKQVSAGRFDACVVQNLDRICRDEQYLESLSFMLNRNNPGACPGLELTLNPPATTSENLKNTLEQALKIASITEVINKGVAMKNLVKQVFYSKEKIEVELFIDCSFSYATDKIYPPHIISERPKMPPSIFGREDFPVEISTAAAKNSSRNNTVCTEKEAPRVGFEPTTK